MKRTLLGLAAALASMVVLTGAMLLGIFRWLRWARWQPSRLPLLLPYLATVLVFPLPYYLTHASMDYRQPIESVILVLVVASFALRPERPVLEALSFEEDSDAEYQESLEEVEMEEEPVPIYSR